MRVQVSTLASAVLPVIVLAGALPSYDGLSVLWSDSFHGSAGDSVNTSIWTIAEAIDTNEEVQSYSKATSNLQISGGGTVQFVPWKSSSGQWTSGRIESLDTWTPPAGGIMQVEASLRMGSDSPLFAQGMWPAVWMMGDSIHHGTDWPACGEVDIFETVNKDGTVYGTVHCTASACYPNGEQGLQGSTATDDDWHTYAVKIDRTSNDWTTESISWMKDGNTFFTVTGATIGEQASWSTLAHSPLYLIINLAVGGSWPGDPSLTTLPGYGNMLEVEYAAVYTS
ncbi:Glucan endo-1,3-beta-glucosidase A1 [Cytospora mali]|uniref:Glucan endo-1,3-beta-glucosidase A1 n=1 Tax=Cytospora mali TaxID=578113 RepID=A0A194WDC9_CYTMA|nr:Glucan endo-1,3-beta-glucosidase A1 [Valsa mali]